MQDVAFAPNKGRGFVASGRTRQQLGAGEANLHRHVSCGTCLSWRIWAAHDGAGVLFYETALVSRGVLERTISSTGPVRHSSPSMSEPNFRASLRK